MCRVRQVDSGERMYRQRASVSTHGRPVYHDGVFGYYLMYQETYSRWVYVQVRCHVQSPRNLPLTPCAPPR